MRSPTEIFERREELQCKRLEVGVRNRVYFTGFIRRQGLLGILGRDEPYSVELDRVTVPESFRTLQCKAGILHSHNSESAVCDNVRTWWFIPKVSAVLEDRPEEGMCDELRKVLVRCDQKNP